MLCGSEPTKFGGQWLRHRWIMAIAVVALVAVHGVVLTFIVSHTAISLSAAAGLMALIAIKHLGLLGPAFAALRRWWHDRTGIG